MKRILKKMKVDELLREAWGLLDEVHSGNVIGEEESRQQMELSSRISNYLNRKDKLVVGMEWVCDVDNETHDIRYLSNQKEKVTFQGIIHKYGKDYVKLTFDKGQDIMLIDQFLACFSPKI